MRRNILTLLFVLFSAACFAQYNFIDSTYGVNGLFYRTMPNGLAKLFCNAGDTSGTFYLAGKYEYASFPDHDWAIMKLKPNGMADSSFSDDGVAVARGSASEDGVTAMAIQPDGKLLAAGYVNLYGAYTMVRFTTAGIPDTTFGTGGTITLFGNQNDGPTSVQVDSAGRIYVATLHNASKSTLIARYKPDGKRDSTFNGNGYKSLTIAPLYYWGKILLLPSGKIFVYGHTGPNLVTDINYTLFRLKDNGTLDSTFGTNGMVVTDRGTERDELRTIVRQPDGKLLIGGTLGNYPNYRPAVTRYYEDGTIDSSFGINGLVDIDHPPVGIGHGSQVLLRSDGKIMIVSKCDHNTNQSYVYMQRLNADGSRDSTYANNGELHALIPKFPVFNTYLSYMLPDNRILFSNSGYVTGSPYDNFQAVRFKAEHTYTSLPVGIDEEEITAETLLYPNPVTDLLHINSNIQHIESVKIYNINGKLMLAVSHPVDNMVDVSNLTTGVFIAEIDADNKIQRSRIVKW